MKKDDFEKNVMAKKAAGEAAVKYVKDGMIVGLGTGSTTFFFIESLAKKCKEEGLKIVGVPTSIQTYKHAKKLGIPLRDDQTVTHLDLTVDGADEIDAQKNMIKGGGGALLREKILATSSQQLVIVVDEKKVVHALGKFPVPVEISSFAYQTTIFKLICAGYKGSLRLQKDHSIYLTDNQNYIFDIQFKTPIANLQLEDQKLKEIVGVIETGLFYRLANEVIIGYYDGTTKNLT